MDPGAQLRIGTALKNKSQAVSEATSEYRQTIWLHSPIQPVCLSISNLTISGPV